MNNFKNELTKLLNFYGVDAQCNVADDILAVSVIDHLASFAKIGVAQRAREAGAPSAVAPYGDVG